MARKKNAPIIEPEPIEIFSSRSIENMETLIQFRTIYPNAPGAFVVSGNQLVFWRESDAQKYKNKTGDSYAYKTRVQIVAIIND